MTAKLKEALKKHVPPCETYECTLRETCAKFMMSCQAFNEWVDLKPKRAPKFPEEFPSTETFLELLEEEIR